MIAEPQLILCFTFLLSKKTVEENKWVICLGLYMGRLKLIPTGFQKLLLLLGTIMNSLFFP